MGLPDFLFLCFGLHRSSLDMGSSILLQQCPAKHSLLSLFFSDTLILMFKSSVFCVFLYLGDASQVPSSAFSRPICGIIGIIRLLAGKTIPLRGVGGKRVGG